MESDNAGGPAVAGPGNPDISAADFDRAASGGNRGQTANDAEFLRAAQRSRDLVLLRYFDSDGRLITMPAKQSRKLAVLDIVAGRFIPGVHYSETEVNRELIGLHQDYVTLRRALIDFGLMDRAGGEYWRSGGSVEL